MCRWITSGWVVRSWSVEGSSRLLWCQKALTWEDIEALQQRLRVHDSLVFVDAGYNSYEVYRQCARHGWTALMGDQRATFTHKRAQGPIQRFYSPVRKIAVARGLICRMHFWSNLNVKDVLARLRRNQDPSQGATWEIPEDVPEDYCLQMESEHRVKKNGKWAWEQIGSRGNHLFDCECLQVVAAVMMKLVGREAASEGVSETSEVLGKESKKGL